MGQYEVIYNACNWSVWFLDRWTSVAKAGKAALVNIEAIRQNVIILHYLSVLC